MEQCLLRNDHRGLRLAKYDQSNFYRLQTKFREGNVFTPVCQSFCSHGGVHPLGRHPLPPCRPLPKQTRPPMATEAGGMHPIGMHSCQL